MITNLEIIYFQSWKYASLDFVPGVNIIKGTSHKGKSAIMRSLRWALFNRPRGEAFKSHFAKDKDDINVSIVFDDDQWILRSKGKENNYLSEHLELSAIKSDVPDEIKEITRINEINFQRQGDEYFLLDKTPGYAGKMLNEFIGLQIIDEVRTKINRHINKLNTKIGIVKENITETETKLDEYKHLDKAKQLADKIDSLKNKVDKKTSKLNDINTIVNAIKAHRNVIKDLKRWLAVEADYKKLKKRVKTLETKKKQYFKLEENISRLKYYSEIIEENKELLKISPVVKDLKKQNRKLSLAVTRHDKIHKICSDIRKLKRLKEQLIRTIKIDSKRLLELKTQYEKELEYCPKCGSLRKHWRPDYTEN